MEEEITQVRKEYHNKILDVLSAMERKEIDAARQVRISRIHEILGELERREVEECEKSYGAKIRSLRDGRDDD
eukprot:CAMPEP_0119145276 /NCGR_PEP_ID=MMETSP1310-20130426/37271_1 /TAXON_ID=464262 /ORGANISM="Genus nov. species nov., Strain RCC2339" /LENGTH=72 /DNA_ID=CAMNT_0007137083 /DNA_START=173 /DNA_END=391 /DNA_ORIENTATION=+